MNYTQLVLFSFSIFFAAIIGLARFKNLDREYYPFIYCTWLAAINEVVSFLLTRWGFTNIINNNIYILLEALFITWQFKKWDTFGGNTKIFTGLFKLILVAWLLEYTVFSSINKVGFFCRIFYALLIVLMSINITSWLLVNSRGVLLKNPTFLICAGYIIFFTFKILTEALWLFGVTFSEPVSIQVYIIFTWINFFVNILFFIAVLCIPPRPRLLSFS
ncbi:MAG: hypothetical protein ABJB11_13645 [Ferruginibacter sp.]